MRKSLRGRKGGEAYQTYAQSESCWRGHDSVKLIKFADDTALIGLISNNDESAYRREVDRLVSWCSGNNLELNAQKTVEMIVDFRKSTVPPPPPSVMDSPITSVESFRFLGTTITQDLKWEPTISSLIKKAQQRMYFLRQLRKAKLPAQMLVQFYTAIIESILTSSVTVWFAGATVRDKQRLQHIVRSAEEVIGRSLPSLQDLVADANIRPQKHEQEVIHDGGRGPYVFLSTPHTIGAGLSIRDTPRLDALVLGPGLVSGPLIDRQMAPDKGLVPWSRPGPCTHDYP
uniref:Alkylated DNA repair protein AlkB homologue 8 N-terminal domain-containing protein n=1 Tax=Knipowitschia caucasica TaxID=637954 RepID=A0AAV2J3E9_KNICA